jgi:hypothetical protein
LHDEDGEAKAMEDGVPLNEEVETTEGPWLVLRYRPHPDIRLDMRFVDRVLATDEQLFIEVGPLSVALKLESDAATCARLATELAPYTRSARITRREAYVDAKRRLELAQRNRSDNGSFSIYIGDLDLYVRSDKVYLGDTFVCPLLELALAAQNGDSISLRHPRGVFHIQAALALLVAAAQDRPVDNVDDLADRIAEYERAQNA